MRATSGTVGCLALGSLALAWLAACKVEVETRVEGVGVSVKQMTPLDASPREIFVEDGLRLTLLPPTGAEGPSVELEGCENLLRYVRVRTSEGGELHLEVERGYSLDPAPRVLVVSRGVAALRCIGAGSAEVLGLEGESFVLDLTGSESLRATGRLASLEMNAVGSGAIDLSGLVVDRAQVQAIGNGRIRLHAEERADVSAIGSGVVTVSGPAELESSVVGSGGVERAER